MSNPLTPELLNEFDRWLEESPRIDAQLYRMLIRMGMYTGYRIHELLSLTARDVYFPDGTVREQVSVARANMKGKRKGRTVGLNPELRSYLKEYRHYLSTVNTDQDNFGSIPLFPSPQDRTKPISYPAVSGVFRRFRDAAHADKITSHSMRKFFGEFVYKATGGNLLAAQRALGHTRPDSTTHYLRTDEKEIQAVVNGITLGRSQVIQGGDCQAEETTEKATTSEERET